MVIQMVQGEANCYRLALRSATRYAETSRAVDRLVFLDPNRGSLLTTVRVSFFEAFSFETFMGGFDLLGMAAPPPTDAWPEE